MRKIIKYDNEEYLTNTLCGINKSYEINKIWDNKNPKLLSFNVNNNENIIIHFSNIIKNKYENYLLDVCEINKISINTKIDINFRPVKYSINALKINNVENVLNELILFNTSDGVNILHIDVYTNYIRIYLYHNTKVIQSFTLSINTMFFHSIIKQLK